MHDARIFANSSVNELLREHVIPDYKRHIVENCDPVPVRILGDQAYPLLPFLMKEFPGDGNTAEEQFFGYRLSSVEWL